MLVLNVVQEIVATVLFHLRYSQTLQTFQLGYSGYTVGRDYCRGI